MMALEVFITRQPTDPDNPHATPTLARTLCPKCGTDWDPRRLVAGGGLNNA